MLFKVAKLIVSCKPSLANLKKMSIRKRALSTSERSKPKLVLQRQISMTSEKNRSLPMSLSSVSTLKKLLNRLTPSPSSAKQSERRMLKLLSVFCSHRAKQLMARLN